MQDPEAAARHPGTSTCVIITEASSDSSVPATGAFRVLEFDQGFRVHCCRRKDSRTTTGESCMLGAQISMSASRGVGFRIPGYPTPSPGPIKPKP